MPKMSEEFRKEIIERLNELYDRATNAANKNITLRFMIDLDDEWAGDVHVMNGTEYRQQGNVIQIAMSTRRGGGDKKQWISSQLWEIEREYQIKDWMP